MVAFGLGNTNCAQRCGSGQAGRARRCELGRAGFRPAWTKDLRNPFLFPFDLNSYLNFENLYLSVQGSKNYETSFIGFIVL
jgi:hypothetical protein